MDHVRQPLSGNICQLLLDCGLLVFISTPSPGLLDLETIKLLTYLKGTLALPATFTPDSLVKNPHTDPFQTGSKLGHPNSPNAPKFESLKLPYLKTNANYVPFL